MRHKTAQEKSVEKTKLLRNRVVSALFMHYFNENWQAKEILDRLRACGANVQHLREWALWSFHPLGDDEAEEKRKRGRLVRTQLKKALVGYENAITFYSQYASAPHFGWPESKTMSSGFQNLVRMNQYLAGEATQMLRRATASAVYKTKRLGVNWNCSYLCLSKMYIAKFTGWDKRRILGAITHLVTAAQKSVRNRVPRDLRSLLRKALRTFENDRKNAVIIERLQRAVADPNVLAKMFPPIIANPH